MWCFAIANYSEVQAAQPDALQHLESDLPSAGAPSTLIDTVRGRWCVTVTDPSVTVADLLALFARHGYKARWLPDEES